MASPNSYYKIGNVHIYEEKGATNIEVCLTPPYIAFNAKIRGKEILNTYWQGGKPVPVSVLSREELIDIQGELERALRKVPVEIKPVIGLALKDLENTLFSK